MDSALLAEARRINRRLFGHIRLTIPSVLATDERFALRITVFDPTAMPDTDFAGELCFAPSPGIEGLPERLRLGPDDGGVARIDGLRATGDPVARVLASIDGVDLCSNPAWVSDDPPYRVFWGDLHVHTTASTCQQWACKSPHFAYAYAQEVAHLDFCAVADHLRGLARDADRWPTLQELARRYNLPGEFVALLAFESSHRTGMGGDNNAYYLGDEAPYFWREREDMYGIKPAVPLEDLWTFLRDTGQSFFTAPHHTTRDGKYRTFDCDTHDPEAEPLFEIYSAWGSSECPGNRYPLAQGNTGQRAYFTDALALGCRFGVIASSDDHTTLPGGESRNWGSPWGPTAASGYHHMGMAAVRAPALTRPELFANLRARNCYATTCERTMLDFSCEGVGMGQAVTVDPGDALTRERRLTVALNLGRQRPVDVVLMRGDRELDRRSLTMDRDPTAIDRVTFHDTDALTDVAIRGARHHPDPFVVYYVRLESRAGHTQWSSPIWFDLG